MSLTRTLAAKGRAVFEDLPPAGLAYELAVDLPDAPLLVVCADDERAERVAADLRAFGCPGVAYFPGEPHVPFEDVSPDPAQTFARLALRQRLSEGERPRVLVTSAAAAQGRWMPREEFERPRDIIVPGEIVDREGLAARLTLCGYQRVTRVEDEGTFSVRGGIIDVYAPGAARPARLDLFGDEVASIKTFDPESQRTFEALEALTLHPIRDVVFDDEAVARATTALEEVGERFTLPSRRVRATVEEIGQRNYFYGIEALWPAFYATSERIIDALIDEETLVILDDPAGVFEAIEARWEKAASERQRALDKHRVALEVEAHLVAPAALITLLEARARVRSTRLVLGAADEKVTTTLSEWSALAREIQARRSDASRGEILEPVAAGRPRLSGERYDVLLVCQSRGHAERLRELMRGRKLDIPVKDALPKAVSFADATRRPRVLICCAALAAGLLDRSRRVALITDVEVLGAEPSRAKVKRRRKAGEGLSTLRDLAENDLVVHTEHGVGRYLGLKRLILNGVDGDYVHLEYEGGDKLYVPTYRLNVLQRYRGGSDEAKLDKLGGSRWARAKQRVKDAVLALAHELLALQARRALQPGLALPAPDDHYRAFEAAFPYEETPDQQKAIDDVLRDLTSGHPMDRVIIGDVGYGKTEVAIRGTMLAVAGGYQVAVLVPTTVLAEQHGERFRERLSGSPVSVEVLSRFRSAKDTRDLLLRLREGRVDVLIGTHRMLSADVGFKNLGLLVVDEEQRFGVKHKERIKQFRAQVHVLTMSATPIPRTMHMATVGLRDMSIITTPPAERTGIRTEVARFDEAVITEAIRRELHRGGQVFVVHNRVHSIGTMASLVKKLVPEARVAVGHGQMQGDELEKIMVGFVRRESNVLVCTAIIESGLDIPAANTMIVNRADTFGLAQLYQLRGRIGRARERAFAYLLLPHSDALTREATERLALLKRFSDLGAGFQIASHDLDMRGAGDLLGAEQSGHIAAVGYELYTELLAEAVERAKGQHERVEVEPDIKLPVVAVLPESYLPDPMLRLELYQRMATAQSDEGVFDVFGEISDRFGEPPEEVAHLAEVMVIRRRLKALGASALSGVLEGASAKLGLTFVPNAPIDRDVLARRLQQEPSRYRLLPSGRLAITLEVGASATNTEFLRAVRQELGVFAVVA